MSSSKKNAILIQATSIRSSVKLFTPVVTLESNHLLNSNKVKIEIILKRLSSGEPLTTFDIIEGYISLHLYFEIAVNKLLRNIALRNFVISEATLELSNYIDDINFRDKVIAFICFERFIFHEEEVNSVPERIKKLSDDLKDFTIPRNKLLHGHALVSWGSSKKEQTKANKHIKEKEFKSQIRRFHELVEDTYFFIDRLDPLPRKHDQYRNILDNSFIPSSLLKDRL